MNDKKRDKPLDITNSTIASTHADNAIQQYQKAVALQYDGVSAPVVTATGSGQLAEDIIALARACEIPLYENAELTEMLALLDLGDQIPHELYIIIAQIIALAYKLQDKRPPITSGTAQG